MGEIVQTSVVITPACFIDSAFLARGTLSTKGRDTTQSTVRTVELPMATKIAGRQTGFSVVHIYLMIVGGVWG